ncbi:hypothetical protein OV450_5629 [Actinobacteria bacterium OV450]|nr:hypothetical protein OV450_5629 [Actinobacteria bacterium OV450]
MKLSPSATHLLGETLDADMKSTLTVWETRTAEQKYTESGSGAVFYLMHSSFSPDEAVFSVPGSEEHGFTWLERLQLGGHFRHVGPVLRNETTQSECYPGTAPRFTADDSRLRCVGTDGVLRSFDVSAFTHARDKDVYYTAGAVSGDLRTLALPPRILPRHPHPAVRGQAGRTEPACRGLLKPHGEDRVSRDGRLAAVLQSATIEIWDTADEKRPVLGSLPVVDQQVRSGASIAFAFSPDRTSPAVQVVTKDEVNTLTFRDLTTMRQIRKASAALGHTLRPMGQALSTGRTPWTPGQLVRDLCAVSGPLSEQEWKTHIPDVPYLKTC